MFSHCDRHTVNAEPVRRPAFTIVMVEVADEQFPQALADDPREPDVQAMNVEHPPPPDAAVQNQQPEGELEVIFHLVLHVHSGFLILLLKRLFYLQCSL